MGWILVALIFSPFAEAYEWKHAGARELSQRIEQSLKTGDLEGISSTYSQLPRWKIDASDLIELRFQMQHWRKSLADRWTFQILSGEDVEQYTQHIEALDHLNLKLNPQLIGRIIEHRPREMGKSPTQEELGFIGNQAEPTLDLGIVHAGTLLRSGPPTLLEIPPVHRSPLVFDQWKKNKDLRKYEYSREGVLFRGLELHSGDLLLTDFNLHEGSLLSSINGAESLLSHLAILVMLEDHQGKLPIVIDMFGFGLRAIPLNTFLSTPFSSYTEVFRLENPPIQLKDNLNELVTDMLAEKKGKFVYDMTWTSTDPRSLTCAKLGNYVLNELGIPQVEQQGLVRSKIIENFSVFGLNVTQFLSPQDYARDPRFLNIGTIDNGFFTKDVAKQVSAFHLAEFLGNKKVSLEKLPQEYFKDRDAIASTHHPSWKVWLYLRYKGFTGMVTIPHGSPDFLAFLPLFSKAFAGSVGQVETQIQDPLNHMTNFSIHDYQESNEVRSWVEQSMDPLEGWFTLGDHLE